MNTQSFSDFSEPDTLEIGLRIANKVADQLQKGNILGCSHRDYCGMGMKMNEGQEFLYGELYDGFDFHVPRIFKNRASFVTWLSAQSTASLARLDDEEFFRDNQVITRSRLIEFIAS
ncbi:hypothetical protein [Chryseobacterium sp. W4I1]|uniref:hypothetical protein n=1 Tax=Chryseobacterium sp. W4I1 TaxID=3042293 RepID=UPI002782D099|nr:hypothetical protein [Chryseobacterium sp. W4I1]MDQ0781847.1 hypothetical protein [Chryseobacterium sp. W4I1]